MDTNDERPKSRTQKKKEAAALQKTGERLLLLGDDQLARMGLPAVLIEAIRAAKGMPSHGARRRQLQYIGTLMRQVEAAPIEQALLEIDQGAYRQARDFRQIESWRDRLLDGDDALMEHLLHDFPQAERQRLGQLVRSARKERLTGAPPTSARNLFRYLKILTDS